MDISKIKEGKMVSYATRFGSGRGKVIEVYKLANGMWVIVNDKARNAAVSLRPSQIS